MSQEILYTSAPQGLKPGSKGFCTVVSTQGMAKNLAERLEQMSGYRHAFTGQEAKTKRNPINYSHYAISLGGNRFHILSRIADAGYDYTNRTNKLAHHVALDEREALAVKGGPAWVLALNGFCETQFAGEPRLLNAGRQPPQGDCPIQVCNQWKRLTGDAGWAGVLAEAAVSTRGRPVLIVYPHNEEMLPLVVEAMSLLPPERRWKVNFSTYFTKLPAGAECQWRFLLDGTNEANAARRNPHQTVVDLCGSLGPAKGGNLVEAARSGQMPERQAADEAAPDIGRSGRFRPVRAPRATAAKSDAAPIGPTAAEPVPPPTPAGQPQPMLAPLGPADYGSPLPRRSSSPLSHPTYVGAAVVLGLLLLGVGFAFGYIVGQGNAPPAGTEQDIAKYEREKQEEAERQRDTLPAPEPPPVAPPKNPDPEPDEFEPAPTVEVPPEDVDKNHIAEQPKEPEPQPKEPDPPPPPSDPFKEVNKLNRRLPFAVRKHGDLGVPKPVDLATILVDQPKQCEMALVGLEYLTEDGLTLNTETSDGDGERTLRIELSGKGMLKPQEVGSFILTGQKLRFEWDRRAKDIPLQYCLLRLKAPDNQTVLCHLGTPDEVEPVPLTFNGTQRISRSIPTQAAIVLARLPSNLVTTDSNSSNVMVGVDVHPEGFPENISVPVKLTQAPPRGSRPLAGFSTNIFGENSNESVFDVDTGLTFEEQESQITVHLKKYYFANFFRIDSGEIITKRIIAQRRSLQFPGEDVPGLIDIKNICENLTTDIKTRRSKTEKDLEDLTVALDGTAEAAGAQRQLEQAEKQAEDGRKGKKGPMLHAYNERINEELKPYRDKVHDLRVRIDTAKNFLRHLDKGEKFVEQNLLWCDQMQKLMAKLEADGKIHFRIYYELEGEKIELVRTKAEW